VRTPRCGHTSYTDSMTVATTWVSSQVGSVTTPLRRETHLNPDDFTAQTLELKLQVVPSRCGVLHNNSWAVFATNRTYNQLCEALGV
jgi:hypothetical protein